MTMEAKVASNNNKIHMKKILVPVDGSEYSLTAAKYAIRIAKRENAQLFCIHVMVGAISLMRRNHIRRLLVTGEKENADDGVSRRDEKLTPNIKTISPVGAVTLMSIVGNMPEESLELAEIESPNPGNTVEQVIMIVCPYCQSKFDNKADLSKHIDRIHLGSGLLEGDVRKW